MKDNLALLISIGSALIACISLGWNIYRDVLLRARTRVHLSIVVIVQAGHEGPVGQAPKDQHISLQITNLGPGTLRVTSVIARSWSLVRRLVRRRGIQAFIMPDYTNRLSARLPAKLEVGEQATFLFPYDANSFLKDGFSQVGLLDSFGRMHWANGASVKKSTAEFLKDFPELVHGPH